MSMEEKRTNGAMRIFEALSAVDEELLATSEMETKQTKVAGARLRRLRRAGGLATAACLVIGLAVWGSSGPMFVSKDSAANESVAETPAEAEPEEAAEDAIVEAPAEAYVEAESGSTDQGAGNQKQQTQQSIKDLEQSEHSTLESATSCPVDTRVDISEEEARQTAILGKYVPTVLPVGYTWENGKVTTNDEGETTSIFLLWVNGMDSIALTISMVDSEGITPVDVTATETYDVRLYEIPYMDTVPAEYMPIFDAPVFAEKDFDLEIVEARMKTVDDTGDTDTPKGQFAVLYGDGVLVEFNGRGTAQEIWELFRSMK